MMRYVRLYMYFLRFSFSKAMEFKLDFYFRIVMDVFYYMINIFFFKLIYLHTTNLGGWNEGQAMIFVAGTLLLDAIVMTVFANNMWWFPIHVNKGDLDYYITKPVSTLFFLSLREFAGNSFVNLLMTIGIFIWSINTYTGVLETSKIILYLLLVINGAVLHYVLNMMFYFPVFWTGSPRGFGNLYWALMHAAERPDRIYSGWIRKLFTFVLPFVVMISFPARLLFEVFDWTILLQIVGITIATWIVYLFLWSKALRAYTSASS
jgi:ABC-2 type transport system permease protein